MRRGRRKHDDILTPREWQVLELIEAGLTNEEIGERLGISFGTTKYHVAEILSKLGVERREEAPAAARRAQAPVVPFWRIGWMRNRFVGPAIAVLVVAALLLVSLAAFTDLLRNPSASAPKSNPSNAAADFQPGDAASQADLLTRSPARLSSYYYDLHVSSRMTRNEPMTGTLATEVWFKAPNKWRVRNYKPSTGESVTLVVSDGETVWHYDMGSETYYRRPAQPDARPVPSPLFGPVDAENLQQFMEKRKDGPRPPYYWEVTSAREAVNGIDAVQLVQACCREGEVDQLIGEKHYWIDPTYNFLLKMEQTNPDLGSDTLYEMTDVQYNPDLDSALFTFQPPEGATEVPPP